MIKDAVSGLILPNEFVDEKQALKKTIDELVDKVVCANQHIDQNYFLTLHAKFDKWQPDKFVISQPVITYRLPPFLSNTMVFWVCNRKGLCEILWMVTKKDGKLKVEFNTKGVAYLQAKGAMPS